MNKTMVTIITREPKLYLFADQLLILQEYKYISSKRIAYFYSSKPQPHQFTVVVRSIPVSVGSSISDSIETFFTEYHPSTYLSHIVVRRTNRLRGLIVSIQSDVYYPCSVGIFSVLPLLKMKFFFLKNPTNCQEITSLVLDFLNLPLTSVSNGTCD